MPFAFVRFSPTWLKAGTPLLGDGSPWESKGGLWQRGVANLGPSRGIPEQGWLYQVLNNSNEGVLGPVMQSANSEMTGRRKNDKSLLSCCFGVVKKHMEVSMELLDHQRGSVLTLPRQRALCLPVHPCLWVGGTGEAQGMLWVHSSDRCDPQGLWELHLGHQGNVALVLGCRACRAAWLQAGAFPWHRRATPALPLGARDDGYWSRCPTQSVPSAHLLHSGIFLQAQFRAWGWQEPPNSHLLISTETNACLASPPPLPGSACAQRLGSLSIFRFEVTSQLAQCSGFLCSERPGQGEPGSVLRG